MAGHEFTTHREFLVAQSDADVLALRMLHNLWDDASVRTKEIIVERLSRSIALIVRLDRYIAADTGAVDIPPPGRLRRSARNNENRDPLNDITNGRPQ